MAKPKKREIEKTAYHEAGHAVMSVDMRCPFQCVTIDKKELDENCLGQVKGGLSKPFFDRHCENYVRDRFQVESSHDMDTQPSSGGLLLGFHGGDS